MYLIILDFIFVFFLFFPDLQDSMDLFDYNVPQRVNEFVAAAVAQVRCWC